MSNSAKILTDQFDRVHKYLRISLTEKCNLRCTYCMPAGGIQLSPKSHLMSHEEVYQIAKIFVQNGVNKIRLTGGEPLVRKDFAQILAQLSHLNVTLALTTNALLVDQYIDDFKKYHLNKINVSLDSLKAGKFAQITRRNQFQKTYDNILLLLNNGFEVKINTVLMKGVNDDEILDFINLTKDLAINVRFIEFMPFDGNKWNQKQLVSQQEIINIAIERFGNKLIKLSDGPNYIARHFKIEAFKGQFGIISSVSNPFCEVCDRIRLTADGKIKNCLFSNIETDLLAKYRAGEPLEPLIYQAIYHKKAVRAGMDNFDKLKDPNRHTNNRSMTAIGG